MDLINEGENLAKKGINKEKVKNNDAIREPCS